MIQKTNGDDRFVLTYCNPRTAREHRIICTSYTNLEAECTARRNQGMIVNYVPLRQLEENL